jgi:hypothetical protein
MFDFEVRRLSEMTQMLGRRVERLETQDRPASGTAGGGGTASFSDAAGDPSDVGTAAADGVSSWAARLDHVHAFPRALMFSDAAGNPGTVGTAAASDGTLTYAARLDHVHAFTFDKTLMFNDGAGAPADVGTVAADGVSVWAARADHVHAYTGSGAVSFSDAEGDPATVGTVAADGTSTFPARRDHAHVLDGTVTARRIRAQTSGTVTISDASGNVGLTVLPGGGIGLGPLETSWDVGAGKQIAVDYISPSTFEGTITVAAGDVSSTGAVQITDNTGTAGMLFKGGTVTATVSGGFIVSATAPTLRVGDAATSTGDAAITLGNARTGDGNAFIDFHTSADAGYEARIIRSPGDDGAFSIVNRGTADFTLNAENAGALVFDTNNTERVRILSTGQVQMGSARLTETLTFNETTTTPVVPGTANQIHMYMRNDRIVFQFRDGATTRWKSLLMTGTGVTWVAGTVAP